MGIFSPRRRGAQDTSTQDTSTPETSDAAEAPEQGRPHGPWDVSERPDLDGRVDFGALRFRVPPGYVVQRPANDKDNTVPVVLLRGPEGALRLRVFAAPRDGGKWDDLRADVVREVEERDGTATEVDGPFGREVRCVLKVTSPDGQPMVQPSRVLGHDGPRWTLRGTFLGPVAKDPQDHGDLMDAFLDVVVVRGPEPRRAGEVLPLRLPPGARGDAETSSDEQAVSADPDAT
ncbi:DUF3710 domain-containing protein [Aeromicrobium sp. Leaf350]|uniref:DUF3710 domain-containing protein n=1 Tax=Aeromicrobium sp. Leaf350 TaxID=2876565 RepID=UPI001E406D48|nr:DUF3710 domain-containing protein [Aeromicrobium sp. Leaf350]